MSTTTKRPRLVVGHTYRITFADAETGTRRYSTTVTIVDKDQTWSDKRASAVHAYISRWIRHGRNTVEIVEVAA